MLRLLSVVRVPRALVWLALALLSTLLAAAPARAEGRRSYPTAALDPEIAALPNAAGYWLPDPIFEGGTIYLIEAGPEGGAPPVFLVHGLGDKGVRDFYPVLSQLAKKRRVVAFDLPGFGRSTHANQRYAPDRYNEVLANLVNELAGGPIDLVGHSMGGAISLEYAGRHPAQVRRLVLVDAAGILHREAFVGQQVTQATKATGRLIPKLTEIFRAATGTIVKESRRLDPAPEVILSSDLLRKTFLRGDPGKIAALALILHDFSPAIAALEAPTLIVWGEKDLVAPPRTGIMLVERLKQAELVTLKGVGHVPMEDAPAQLLTHLERHLDAATIVRPPKAAPGKSQGDLQCKGRSDLHLRGTYDRIVLERCDRVSLDGVQARELVMRGSRATVSRTSVARGVVVEASDLVMTGGRVGGTMDVDGSRVDLAGVSLEGDSEPYRLKGESNVIFSVCPLRTQGGLGHVHGIKTSQSKTRAPE